MPKGQWVRLVGLFLLLAMLSGCGFGSGSGSKEKAAGAAKAAPEMSEFGFAWGSYTLRVPGAAYVTSDGNKEKLVVSSGTKTQSTLTLNKDGTYVWDSAWDGKVIKGAWAKTDDKVYVIMLYKGQEGKNWVLGKGDGGGQGEILLFDGNYMSYAGDLVK